jgi:hypothetical protein
MGLLIEAICLREALLAYIILSQEFAKELSAIRVGPRRARGSVQLLDSDRHHWQNRASDGIKIPISDQIVGEITVRISNSRTERRNGMTAADEKSRNLVFVSYRRDDSAHATGRIYDRLIAEFGTDAVFRDVDSMQLATHFPSHIQKIITRCDVVLAIIGRRWITVTDSGGRLRLQDPNDFVRLEIETALELGVPVIPLFVDDASLTEQRLPEGLRELAYCHGLPIRRDPDFHADVNRLVRELKKFFEGGKSPRRQTADEDTIRYPNGNKYVGGVRQGRPHGHGTMIYATGVKYIGEWKDGKKHGWGILAGEGSKYVGEWQDGQKTGLWGVTYADGTKYAGEWRKRSFHGLGILTWPDGGKYVGEWKGGRKHGRGILLLSDGSRYDGDWQRNVFHGRGTFTYADGSFYVGEWKEGKRHGEGIYYDKDGQIESKGHWENDRHVDD